MDSGALTTQVLRSLVLTMRRMLMNRISQSFLAFAGAALLFLAAPAAWADASEREHRAPREPRAFSADQELVNGGFLEAAACCVPDGSVDDTLGMWSCCSGFAVSGSTVCTNPSDYGTTWQSCRHVCGTAPSTAASPPVAGMTRSPSPGAAARRCREAPGA